MQYLHAIVAGDKWCLLKSDVVQIKVPRYREFSLDKMFEKCKDDTLLISHLPGEDHSARQIDRTFAYNNLNSLRSEFLRKIVNAAQNDRIQLGDGRNQGKALEIHPQWVKLLLDLPFVFSKCHN